jgi:hypothetical protein
VLVESISYVDSIIFLPFRSSNKINMLLEFLSTAHVNLTPSMSQETRGTRTLQSKPPVYLKVTLLRFREVTIQIIKNKKGKVMVRTYLNFPYFVIRSLKYGAARLDSNI